MPLTAQQEQVLALISAGSSITAAAQSAGIHRNTIYNWLRSAAAFRFQLAAARDVKAIYWRDQAEQHAAAAIETIRALMADPNAPASVRLKAAQTILSLATTPPSDSFARHYYEAQALPYDDRPLPPEDLHNFAQGTPSVKLALDPAQPLPAAQTLHKPAQPHRPTEPAAA